MNWYEKYKKYMEGSWYNRGQAEHSLRLGWVIYEEIGVVIINDYAIAKVCVEENAPFVIGFVSDEE